MCVCVAAIPFPYLPGLGVFLLPTVYIENLFIYRLEKNSTSGLYI
jgi:hypothetical protein